MTLKRPPGGGRPEKEAVLPWRPDQLETLQYSSSDRLQKRTEAEDLVQKREPVLEFRTHIFAPDIY